MGLGLAPRGDCYAGKLEGGLVLELYGTSEGRQGGERITARALIEPPIATELRIVPSDGKLPTEVPVGYDFDFRYHLTSSRPERARRLLVRSLQMEIVAADMRGYTVEVTSEQVSVTARYVLGVHAVKPICIEAENLARRLIDAESQLAPLLPWRDVSLAWRAAAERIDGRFDPEARQVSKRTEIGELVAHPRSECEERWFAELRLALDRPLPVEFGLSNESARSVWQRFTDKDVQVGDESFDETFFISTSQPDAVRGLLDPRVRAVLLELERASESIEVSSSEIRAQLAGDAVTDPKPLTDALEAALSAGEALVRAGRPTRGDPYR